MTGRMRPDFTALFAFCDLHASRVLATPVGRLVESSGSAIPYYDRQGFPIPSDGVESSTCVWARRLDSSYRIVAEDELADGSRLSTVWLGLDHGGGGRPLIFETMRFAPLRRRQRFYSSMDFPDPETGEETEQLRSASEEAAQRFYSSLDFPDPETGAPTDQLRSASEEAARAAHHAILRRLRLRLGH
jgi:hypothetical protein